MHTSLANGTCYYYVVTAQNSSGESADSPKVSAVPSLTILVPAFEQLLNPEVGSVAPVRFPRANLR
ncbi:MAG: hypothetical protein HY308_10830 [Gammaproteobacteria bacterium]|nr:hypothetical protein [Gammaproteobacteria bacterium]